MFCTIINDCTDANVIGRQGTRVASLLGIAPTYIGVGKPGLKENNDVLVSEYEAAGCLVDVLDSAEGREGLVLVNIANRHGKGKKWPNGTPFGFFWYGKTLVVSSVDGIALSLVKKLGIVKEFHILDVPTVMDYFLAKGIYSKELCEHVKITQFRSFDFTPRVGAYLIQGGKLPSEEYSLEAVPSMNADVWFIDNFGNCKTSILPEDINFQSGATIETTWGELTCYFRLKDVPNGEKALIIGSSGLGNNRFLEIIGQGVSAEQTFGISVGDRILK